jgi:2-polyprenyl-3-methyl-5-hydroxy-6-metoxy-1,4-benzoquinol methylase
LESQNKISGECLHGGGGGDYWVGYPVVEYAEKAGIKYSEGLSTIYDFPYRFPFLANDGSISIGNILTISHSRSIDSIDKNNKEKYRYFKDWSQERINNGHYFILLNHPDVNFELFKNFVSHLPKDRVNWTSEQAISWWASRNAIKVELKESGKTSVSYKLLSQTNLFNVKLMLHSNGELQAMVSYNVEDRWTRPPQQIENNGLGSFLAVKVDFIKNQPLFLKIISGEVESRRELKYKESLITFEDIINCLPKNLQNVPNSQRDYIYKRVNMMVKVIKEYGPINNLSKAQIIDVGCGYGTYSLTFHLQEKTEKYLAVDPFPRYISIGKMLVEKFELKNIEFIQGRMEQLSECRNGELYDVLVINNSINFLPTKRRYLEAIREFYDALRPGGAVVILTPNRLYYKEAFTKVPMLQFWPRWLATLYVNRKGLRETYDDIRLPSPFELVRWLRKSGFQDVKTINYNTLEEKGWIRYFRPRYFIVATK